MVINKYHTHGIFIVLDYLYDDFFGIIEKKGSSDISSDTAVMQCIES